MPELKVYKGERSITIDSSALAEAKSKGWSTSAPSASEGASKPQLEPSHESTQGGGGEEKQDTSFFGKPPSGFFSGAVATTGLADPNTYKGMGKAALEGVTRTTLPFLTGQQVPTGDKQLPSAGDFAKNMVDYPAIKKDFSEGKYASGAGRIAGQAAMWAAPIAKLGRTGKAVAGAVKEGRSMELLKGGLSGVKEAQGAEALAKSQVLGKEAGKWAQTTGAEKYMMNARAATKDISMALETREQQITDAMKAAELGPARGQMRVVNFSNDLAKLNKDVDRALKYINEMSETERVPGQGKTSSIIAAKDSVQRLKSLLEDHGGVLSWENAREYLKELNNATFAMKDQPSYVTKTLNKVRDIIGEQMQTAADNVGQGAQWKKLQKDWAAVHNWERNHAATLGGNTEQQLATKSGTGAHAWMKGPIGGGLTFGQDSQAQKVMTASLKRSNAALEALKKQVGLPKTPAKGLNPAANALRGMQTQRPQDDDNQLVPSH
jgi:hypothetical protein